MLELLERVCSDRTDTNYSKTWRVRQRVTLGICYASESDPLFGSVSGSSSMHTMAASVVTACFAIACAA